MQPIKPPFLIQYGIAFYTPLVETYSHLHLEITYSDLNPLFNFVHCSTAKTKLWEKHIAQTKLGTLFLYNTGNALAAGFYEFTLTGYTSLGGSTANTLMIGLTVPKDNLILGMPYSIYSPMTL